MPESPSGLGRLVAELKRRRVVRVVLAYLVVAWLTIEVADTVFPNLGLPDWTVRLVTLLAVLGLIPTVVLSWVFDVTAAGIERTAAAAAGDAPAGSAGDSAAAGDAAATGRPRSRRPAFVTGALALLVLPLAGWLAWTTTHDADAFVDSRLAILPFSVRGASDDLAHLREGLPDLLVAALGSDSLLGTVPSRTVLAALDRRGLRDSELLDDVLGDVARELGSGLVLAGGVVSRGADVEVVATVTNGRTGAEIETMRAAAPADSIHLLVDRLANQLVALRGGTPHHRLAAVTTTSRPALEAYMRGASLFRLGRYDEAAAHFDQAIAIDSTFALAAFWLRAASAWTFADPPNAGRATRLAARYKQQLSAEDRTLLEAVVGPHYPDSLPSWSELLGIRELAARRHPQRAELLYHYGDALFHYGTLTGRPRAMEQAAETFERAIRIDSTYIEPLQHAAAAAIILGDTAAYRRYSDLLLDVDSTGETGLTQRWGRHLVLGDSLGLTAAQVLERLGARGAPEVLLVAWSAGFGLAETADAIEAMPEYDDPVSGVQSAAWDLAILEGRPQHLEQTLFARAGIEEDDPEFSWIFLVNSMYWTGDTARAGQAARRVASHPDFRAATSVGCFVALWYARSGQRAALDALELRADSGRAPARQREQNLCLQLVQTIVAQRDDRYSARHLLEALDAKLASGPRVSPGLLELGNIEAARMWEALGELARARTALLRAEAQAPGNIWADRLAEAGRLSEALGDREDAARLYALHLRMRTRPEGVFVQRTEEIRRRLAALQGAN